MYWLDCVLCTDSFSLYRIYTVIAAYGTSYSTVKYSEAYRKMQKLSNLVALRVPVFEFVFRTHRKVIILSQWFILGRSIL